MPGRAPVETPRAGRVTPGPRSVPSTQMLLVLGRFLVCGRFLSRGALNSEDLAEVLLLLLRKHGVRRGPLLLFEFFELRLEGLNFLRVLRPRLDDLVPLFRRKSWLDLGPVLRKPRLFDWRPSFLPGTSCPYQESGQQNGTPRERRYAHHRQPSG